MFVPWVPAKEATKALRDYIAAGGREVEFDVGPSIVPGTVISHSYAKSRYRVEVHGSLLLAKRAEQTGQRLFVNDHVPALVVKAAVDWDARLARGVFEMDRMLTKTHVKVIAQNDLWQIALMLAGHKGTVTAGQDR